MQADSAPPASPPASAPGQAPPPQAGYPGYGYSGTPPPASSGMVINKKILFAIIGLGVLMIWIAQVLLHGFSLTGGVRDALQAVGFTGAMFGAGGAILGGLAAPKMEGWQALGMFLLAGFFLLGLFGSF